MSDVVNFNTKKATTENNNKLWTPVEALRYLADQIEAGVEEADSVAIVTGVKDEENHLNFNFVMISKLDMLETLGLLEAAKHFVLK